MALRYVLVLSCVEFGSTRLVIFRHLLGAKKGAVFPRAQTLGFLPPASVNTLPKNKKTRLMNKLLRRKRKTTRVGVVRKKWRGPPLLGASWRGTAELSTNQARHQLPETGGILLHALVVAVAQTGEFEATQYFPWGVTDHNTPTLGPIFEARLLRTKYDSQYKTTRFRKAVDVFFRATPCTGPTVLLMWSIELRKRNGPEVLSVILCHLGVGTGSCVPIDYSVSCWCGGSTRNGTACQQSARSWDCWLWFLHLQHVDTYSM